MSAGFSNTEFSEWDTFVAAAGGSFLQTSAWAKFQEHLGRKTALVFREEKKNNERVAGGFSGAQYKFPFGSYLYIPRGPLYLGDEEIIGEVIDSALEYAGDERIAFVRVDPASGMRDALVERGFRDIGRAIQPKRNFIIGLNGSEEEARERMHAKTRYNIGVAKRYNVVVERKDSVNERDVRAFVSLMGETAHRQKIKIYGRDYYETMLRVLCGSGGALFVATFGGGVQAVAFVMFFSGRVTYVHGGSLQTHKETMAPYALHWAIMRDAKARGCNEYDMGGVDDVRWPGLTRFKRGFGGTEEVYDNAMDAPVGAMRYALYTSIKRFL